MYNLFEKMVVGDDSLGNEVTAFSEFDFHMPFSSFKY
jgi:hypothetical protein